MRLPWETLRSKIDKINDTVLLNYNMLLILTEGGDEELPPPIPPEEDTIVLIVTEEKIALRYVKKYNQSGYPRMAIYGKVTADRYRFEEGANVEVDAQKIRADGGGKYYKVVPGQADSFGKTIPETPVLYLPETAID